MLGGEVIRQSSGQKSCFFPHPRCPKICFLPGYVVRGKKKMSNINPKRCKTPKIFLPQMYEMAEIGLNFPRIGEKETEKS